MLYLCLRSRQGYFLNEHSGDHASVDMPGPRHNPKSLPLADNWSSISGALRFLIQSADLIPTMHLSLRTRRCTRGSVTPSALGKPVLQTACVSTTASSSHSMPQILERQTTHGLQRFTLY